LSVWSTSSTVDEFVDNTIDLPLPKSTVYDKVLLTDRQADRHRVIASTLILEIQEFLYNIVVKRSHPDVSIEHGLVTDRLTDRHRAIASTAPA